MGAFFDGSLFFDGSAGNDSYAGGDGADSVTDFHGDNAASGGADADRIRLGGNSAVIYGDSGDDALEADVAEFDAMFGGGGDDHLSGSGATSLLRGGPGADAMFDVAAADASDNDDLYGGGGDDQLFGDAQRGGAGNENLYGGPGNDLLSTGLGNDELHGGSGNDVLDARESPCTSCPPPGRDNLYGDRGDDSLDSRDGVAGNDFLGGGSQTVADTCRSDAQDQEKGCEP